MKHILFDLRGCLFDNLLNEEEFMYDSLVNAAIVARSPYLDVVTHKFEPQGVTGFALLKDSHISIHTWPEHSIAKCDIFTCNPKSKPTSAVEYLKERFHATEVVRWACDRSTGIDLVL